MNKKDIDIITNELICLYGLPLYRITRAANMLCLNIGKAVEVERTYFDENRKLAKDNKGNILYRKTFLGEYAIHFQCFFRLSCGKDIIFAKDDLYEASAAILNKPDFDWDTFDSDIIGNNRFDDIISAKFSDPKDLTDFIIEKITVNKYGDLNISFSNGFLLESCADSSAEDDEVWRFFKTDTNDRHLVILNSGIEK